MTVRELIKKAKALVAGRPKTRRQRKKAAQLSFKRLNAALAEQINEWSVE